MSDGSFHGLVRTTDPPLTHSKTPKRYKSIGRKGLHLKGHKRVDETMGFTDGEPIAEVVAVQVFRAGVQDGPGWRFLIGGSLFNCNYVKGRCPYGLFVSEDFRYIILAVLHKLLYFSFAVFPYHVVLQDYCVRRVQRRFHF